MIEVITLAKYIEEEIKRDFSDKRLSGNLVNSIKIYQNSNGGYSIEIPAEIYNMYQYQMHKVIIPTGKGSYASSLNDVGSEFYVYNRKGGRIFIKPHNHKGYVDKAIERGVQRWVSELGYDSKVTTM